PSPPSKRIDALSRIPTPWQSADLPSLRRRPGYPRFHRSTAGADKEFRNRIVGFSDRHYSTLDQSTKKFFAKLADFANFRRHSGATRGHEATVGDLQQRQLPAP